MPVKIQKQLTTSEMELIDNVIRRDHGKQIDAVNAVNIKRAPQRILPVTAGTVSRYVRGRTHVRSEPERRGGKRKLTPLQLRRLDQTRRRLVQNADNEHRVTYENIIEEADLDLDVCQRTVEDALRERSVGYRKPREKIQLSDKDARIRRDKGKIWQRHTKKYWRKKTYVDGKACFHLLVGWSLSASRSRSNKHLPPQAHGLHGFPLRALATCSENTRVVIRLGNTFSLSMLHYA